LSGNILFFLCCFSPVMISIEIHLWSRPHTCGALII
jgi:hypothetical protein